MFGVKYQTFTFLHFLLKLQEFNSYTLSSKIIIVIVKADDVK